MKINYQRLLDQSYINANLKKRYHKIQAYAQINQNKYQYTPSLLYTNIWEPIPETPLTISYYIKRATEIVNHNNKNPYRTLTLETKAEKQIFIINFVFPDTLRFIDTLKQNGIEPTTCLELSEKIKETLSIGIHQILLSKHIQTKTESNTNVKENNLNQLLSQIILSYIPDILTIIKRQYGIEKNPELFINKILEIAYLQPELLTTQKQK